jgi:hypothetical protein
MVPDVNVDATGRLSLGADAIYVLASVANAMGNLELALAKNNANDS